MHPEQLTAAQALAAHDIGVLSATTAFGKTVIAAWLIARRGVNTLVLVHRQQLLEQWIERLATFLDLPKDEIGRFGGGRKRATGRLDVAIIQSLVRKGVVDDRVGDYGHLVVDECHHLSARSFELVARRAKARFVTGLSATVVRKDGHQPLVFMQCGPVRHRVAPKQAALARPFTHTVLVRPTGFQDSAGMGPERPSSLADLYRRLAGDEVRNRMICDEVVEVVREGRFPLVLTERTEHLARLAELLADRVPRLVVLRGGLGKKKLRSALTELAELPADGGRVLLATGRFIGEGFDEPRLDTLFLTLPVSWRGIIAQYAGRLHRLHDGKREVRVYDFADLEVPMQARMYERRRVGYEAIGYRVHLPASAGAGWPTQVELPFDPVWKEAHAETIRRLLSDGIDPPLADLFRQVAGPIGAGIEGDERARSASEAFLFLRLESLPQTAGRFQLNWHLPIPFDGLGQMEVDLLDREGRLVIEVDGSQHLGDPQAYRRDRRKDRLLQENGYFVLRFLAEDVGKNLAEILDAVLRVLDYRRRRLAQGIIDE